MFSLLPSFLDQPGRKSVGCTFLERKPRRFSLTPCIVPFPSLRFSDTISCTHRVVSFLFVAVEVPGLRRPFAYATGHLQNFGVLAIVSLVLYGSLCLNLYFSSS